MTDTSYHEAWAPKPHHHTVHNDQHSSYMCEHCSRLTPPSAPVKVSSTTLHKSMQHVLAPPLIDAMRPRCQTNKIMLDWFAAKYD